MHTPTIFNALILQHFPVVSKDPHPFAITAPPAVVDDEEAAELQELRGRDGEKVDHKLNRKLDGVAREQWTNSATTTDLVSAQFHGTTDIDDGPPCGSSRDTLLSDNPIR